MVIKNQKRKASSKFLFYGLLLYTIIYYSQLGTRISALGKIRIELILGVILLLFCIPRLINKITYNEEEKDILYPIYFFFAAAIISIPTTVAGYNTVNWLIFLSKSFAIFIMIYAAVDSEKKMRWYLYVLVGMAFFIVTEAYMNSISGKGFVVRAGLVRLTAVTGLFEHPNALGGFCAGILPLLYFLFLHEKSWMKKFILIAFGLITLKVITLTQSRSALVGVISFAFFVWVVSKKKALVAIVIFIALLIGWSFLDATTKHRYLSILDSGKIILGEEIFDEAGEKIRRGSMASRYEIITDGLRLFLQRPITGFGIGGYQVARIERLGRWQVAHNAYVQCLAELGIVGFIAWMLILINTFRLFGKTRKIMVERGKIDNANFTYQMTYAFQGYLFVHLTLSMFGHTPYQNYWWISAAISLILIQLLKQKEQVEE